MPTFRHGKLTRIFVDQYDLSTMLREASIASDADTAETSAFGTQDKTFVVGLVGSNATLSGMFSGSAGETDPVFQALLGDDSDHVVSILQEGVGAAGTGIGRNATLMPGKITSKQVTSTISDMVGVSANVVADGPARQGEILDDYVTALSGNGNSATSVDNGASSLLGGVGHLHLPINTRNGSTTFKVQHSTDNSTWVDLITFTAIGSTTIGSQRVEVAGTVNRYLRALWTIGGSSGSLQALVAFARY